jgi:hypothetical protein
MLGELWEIREPLLFLRAHAGRSTFANTDPDALREWYDPFEATKPALIPLKTKADLEIVRSALRLPLPWREKVLCVGIALALPCWFGLREFTYPLRKKIGLAPSACRRRKDGLRSSDQ